MCKHILSIGVYHGRHIKADCDINERTEDSRSGINRVLRIASWGVCELAQRQWKYIDKIADRLGVTIDYLIRGHEIKSDSLTSQETELMDNYRKLTDEGRKIISANVKLLAEK